MESVQEDSANCYSLYQWLKDSTQTLFTMKCIHSVVERFCDWQYTDGIVHLLFAEQVLSTSVLTDAYRLNQLAVK